MKLYPNYAAMFPKIPRPTDHVDQGYGEDDSKLDYYLDSNLIITKNKVKLWSAPGASIGGRVKQVLSPGDNLGYIYSWTKDKKDARNSWLVISSVPGSSPKIVGYILIGDLKNVDKGIAKSTSSGKKFVTEMKEADKINLSPLPTIDLLGDLLGKAKWYIIGILLILLIIVFLRLKG